MVKPTIHVKSNSSRKFKFAACIMLGFAAFLVAICLSGLTVDKESRALNEATAEGKLLESRESLYNNIYVYNSQNYTTMTFGHNQRQYVESVYNTHDAMDMPIVYTQYMTAGVIYARNLKSILAIGFGGGRTDWYLHHFLPEASLTSVELDPAVLDLAKKYFGVHEEPNFHMIAKDGRVFLVDSMARYDIILLDAYRGPFVPFHLLTTEFYQLVKNHLAEGGVMVQNVDPSTMLFDSTVRTINAVFPQMDFYPANHNGVIVAYDGPLKTEDDLRMMSNKRQNENNFRYNLRELLQNRHPLSTNANAVDAQAKILTDDFAPVEALKAIERHNRKWSDQTRAQ